MGKKKVVFEESSFFIDAETGAIKDVTRRQVTKQETEDNFLKLYVKDMSMLYELNRTEMCVLYELLRKTDYENIVSLNSYMRSKIAEDLNIKANTITIALKGLCNSSLIKKIALNTYLINPNVFARGNWSNVKELRVQFSYNELGRHVLCELIEKEEKEECESTIASISNFEHDRERDNEDKGIRTTLNGVGDVDVNSTHFKNAIEAAMAVFVKTLDEADEKKKSIPLQLLN